MTDSTDSGADRHGSSPDGNEEFYKEETHKSLVNAIQGYVSAGINASHFEEAIATAEKYRLPTAGIDAAANIANAHFAFASVLMGAFSNGLNGASNAAFSAALGQLVGMRFGPLAGVAVQSVYGFILDSISLKTQESGVGASIYDVLHSKEVADYISNNRQVLAQGMDSIL